MNASSHSSELPRLQRKARIYGKECVRPVTDVTNLYTPDQLTGRLRELIGEIDEILGGESGLARFGIDFSELATTKLNVDEANLPMQRVGRKFALCGNHSNSEELKVLYEKDI